MADIIRVAEFATDRCQGTTSYGQCSLQAVQGQTYCAMHGGNFQLLNSERRGYHTYLIETVKSDYQDFRNDKLILSLRDELALLRALLSNKLKQCKDESDLALHSTNIGMLLNNLSNTVLACHKLELSLGKYIDKTELRAFVLDIISILATLIVDPELLNTIGQAILGLTEKFNSK